MQPGARPNVPGVLLCILLWLASGPLCAQAPGGRSEVWLVTYGPGEIYWQRFGHNGIWIRDDDLGLDHVFNFGFFDFAQPGFLLRFVQGRLLYFSAAHPAQQEFAQYINENRSIRAQRLNLSPEQALNLADYLVGEVQPDRRDYLYDYYLNNCSTRVRDALDLALNGGLKAGSFAAPAGQGFRDHTRRLSAGDFWLYLGLEIVLGPTIDQPISRWDEFFIPAELAEGMADPAPGGSELPAPLVLEDVMLYQSTLPAPPASPGRWWPRYLLLAAAALVAAGLLTRWIPALWLARSWLLLGSAAGTAMVYFWLGTDHAVAAGNLNLAVFNPLWLAACFGGRLARWTAVVVAVLSGIALLMLLLPPFQYTQDVLAAFLPLNLAAAAVLWRQLRRVTA